MGGGGKRKRPRSPKYTLRFQGWVALVLKLLTGATIVCRVLLVWTPTTGLLRMSARSVRGLSKVYVQYIQHMETRDG